MNEWRVIGFASDYEVSDDGQVRRCVDSVSYKAGKILKPKHTHDGYLEYTLAISGKPKCIRAHRIVAMAFIGPAPTPEHQVAHADGRRKNNHYSNLRWATITENHADKQKHGTQCRGETLGNSRLKEAQVIQIRSRFDSGVILREIADEFGICKENVRNIGNRKTWRHLA
jgi:hypothetical protein